MNKWLKIGGIAAAAVTGMVVLGVAAGIAAFSFIPSPANAQARAERAQQFGSALPFQGPAHFGELGRGGPRGQFGRFGAAVNVQALLAEELGISVAELQNAREEARIEAIEQAVEEGMLSQNQADQLILSGGFGHARRTETVRRSTGEWSKYRSGSPPGRSPEHFR